MYGKTQKYKIELTHDELKSLKSVIRRRSKTSKIIRCRNIDQAFCFSGFSKNLLDAVITGNDAINLIRVFICK